MWGAPWQIQSTVYRTKKGVYALFFYWQFFDYRNAYLYYRAGKFPNPNNFNPKNPKLGLQRNEHPGFLIHDRRLIILLEVMGTKVYLPEPRHGSPPA